MSLVNQRRRDAPMPTDVDGDFTNRQSIQLGGPTPGGVYEAFVPLKGPGEQSQYPIQLMRLRVRHVSGSATTFVPQLLSKPLGNVVVGNSLALEHTAPAPTPVADRYDSGTIAVNTSIEPYGTGATTQVGLWFRGNPDAGTDNIFEVICDFEG